MNKNWKERAERSRRQPRVARFFSQVAVSFKDTAVNSTQNCFIDFKSFVRDFYVSCSFGLKFFYHIEMDVTESPSSSFTFAFDPSPQ